MSTRNNTQATNTVCKNVSAGWFVTWVTLIGGLVLFTDTNSTLSVSPPDAWETVGGTIKFLIQLIK